MRRVTARPIVIASLLLFTCACVNAQSTQSTLSTGTQLVVLDVTVHDRAGHPIRDLRPADFFLREGNTPQAIQSFEEHTSTLPPKLPPMPPLPPGVFTNYSPVPAGSALNILLLDNLNTVTRDKVYIHSQLRKYISQADPNARIAIFGFNGHLSILQGFTSDPAILRAVIESQTSAKQSTQLADPNGMNGAPQPLSDQLYSLGSLGATMRQAFEEASANLRQSEAAVSVAEGTHRVASTLGAFNLLARYLAGFPGRKNIIWFSGSFPITLQLDPSARNPLETIRGNAEDIRATTSLLARARVAVYPVDAREIVNPATFSSGNDSMSSSREADPNLPDDIEKFTLRENQTRASMYQMAEDTGGKAFLEGKPLADAVRLALDDGANFYTLTYVPSKRDMVNDYRSIHVDLQGEPAQHHPRLAYRHGYFADGPRKRSKIGAPPEAPAPLTINYAQAAMQHAAPTPTEILFKAQVLPSSQSTEEAIAAHNSANPNTPFKGPFRRLSIDIAALPSVFHLVAGADGVLRGAVECVVYVYDSQGRLLNTDSILTPLNLTPDNLKAASSGLGFRQEISVPARGDSFVRIGVRDVTTGRFGAVELPASTVLTLAPMPPIP